ncbi:MAG: A24 family peptidase [Acidimicrobiales bacterium]
MADLGFAPASRSGSFPDPAPDPGLEPALEPTRRRVADAWRSLAPARRRLAIGGALAGIACGATSLLVVPVASAVAIGLVGLIAGAAAVVDVHERRLPNRLTLAALAVVAAAAALDSAWTVVDVVVSLTMAAAPLWVVRYGKGLAFGDVKFAAVLGAATGLVHPFAGVVVVWAAALSAGVFAVATGRRRLAFGPWLWAGYVVAGTAAVAFVQVVLEMGGRSWPTRP